MASRDMVGGEKRVQLTSRRISGTINYSACLFRRVRGVQSGGEYLDVMVPKLKGT